MVNWITLDFLADYNSTITLMEKKLTEVINKTSSETIFFLEHSEVYTAGISALENELIDAQGIPVIYTGRGGKFTYHGPGQRVIYPIIDLNKPSRERDIKKYINYLENWIILTLEYFNIKAFTIPGKVGIWVKENNQDAKIAAIGIRVRKWVTYHGIAININTNLERFNGIIPCGLAQFPVTSCKAMGVNLSINEFDIILKQNFERVFL